MAKITLSIDTDELKSGLGFYQFDDQAEFDRFNEFNRLGDPAYLLEDDKPLRFPCLMVLANRELAKGGDEEGGGETYRVSNFFAYRFDAPDGTGKGSWHSPT